MKRGQRVTDPRTLTSSGSKKDWVSAPRAPILIKCTVKVVEYSDEEELAYLALQAQDHLNLPLEHFVLANLLLFVVYPDQDYSLVS